VAPLQQNEVIRWRGKTRVRNFLEIASSFFLAMTTRWDGVMRFRFRDIEKTPLQRVRSNL